MDRISLNCKFLAGKSDAERASFEGLGSVFGNIDGGMDVVDPGAFTKTLAARRPKLLMQHGFADHGVTPVGKFTEVTETAAGLAVKGELFLETDSVRLAYRAMKEGELDGLSIGYIPRRWEYDANQEVRHLKEVDLFEISIVTWPMNEAATITTVKRAAEAGTLTERELEGILRDAGLSKAQAKRVVSHGHRGLNLRDAGKAPDEDTEALIATVKSIFRGTTP